MKRLDRLRTEVHELSRIDDLRARLTMAAVATEVLAAHDLRPIVVGGTAVDTYVSHAMGTSEATPANWRESLDIGTVVVTLRGRATSSAGRVLEEAGFEASPTRGSFKLPPVPYALDLVGRERPSDYSFDHLQPVRFEEWEIVDLPPVHLVGPEDLLFDYMESGVDTRHQRDWTRALAIASVMEQHLDLGYLFTKAHWRRDGRYVEPLERLLRGEPLS